MAKIETSPFDAAEYLTDPVAQLALLEDAFGSEDRAYITHALGVVARARGMTEIAKHVGKSREGLYRALSKTGDPQLSTLLGVLDALGLTFSVRTKPALKRRRRPVASPAMMPRARKAS